MTRKDCVIIARALRNARDHGGADNSTLDIVTDEVVAALAEDNANFNEEKFREAAGCNE